MKIPGGIIIGVVAGILGGMGMGGGTVMIPCLSLFFNLNQKAAQAINLVAFIPMAVVSSFIHFKHGLLKFKGISYFIVPAVISGIAFSFLTQAIKGALLKRLFGGFLIVLSLISLISAVKKDSKKKIKKI